MDLSKLKIEDLEEVTEGYWIDGERLIIISDSDFRQVDTIYCVNNNADWGILSSTNSYKTNGNKAYKIPKPQTRGMESSEIKGYLHDLNKNDCIECALQGDPWQHYTCFSRLSINYSFRKIDKNGKVTEFEIPEIEV